MQNRNSSTTYVVVRGGGGDGEENELKLRGIWSTSRQLPIMHKISR